MTTISTPDLGTVPYDWASRSQLVLDIAGQVTDDPDKLPPVYIISYHRSDNAPTLRMFPTSITQRFTVVVHEEEKALYQAALPDAKILTIPRMWRGYELGAGRARQFVLETAELLGQDRILLLDDDMVNLTTLYAIPGGKVSRAIRSRYDGDPAVFRLGVLGLFAVLSEDAAQHDSTLCLTACQYNNAQRNTWSAATRWRTNHGKPPGQVEYWAMDRWLKYCPEGIDLEHFARHGEDIAVNLQLAYAGASVGNIPCVIGDFWDYETRSVLRNPQNAPALRQVEHDNLMLHPLAPYISTRLDMVGRPQWNTVNWPLMRRDKIVQSVTASWAPLPKDSPENLL